MNWARLRRLFYQPGDGPALKLLLAIVLLCGLVAFGKVIFGPTQGSSACVRFIMVCL